MTALRTLFLGAVAVAGTTVAVTPVEKVIELLKKLSTQVSEDGAKEAKAYDKYACFCKEQADDKLYAIEMSTKKIGSLAAKIAELNGEIDSLNSDISNLSDKIDKLATEIQEDTAKRDGEHATYVINEKDMSDALNAVERAIASLSQSKDDMDGKTENAASLAQVKAVQLIKALQPGKAYESSYHSNDIIAVLEELKDKFIAKRDELDKAEFESKSAFEKRTLNNENKKEFASREKAEKEAQVEAKTESLKSDEQDKSEEEDMKAADGDFMKVLTGECEEKAGQFDQRTKTRTEELTAVTEAIATLESGVKPNYGANKKLAAIQQPPALTRTQWVEAEERKLSPSFLQVRRTRQQPKAVAMEKALELLSLSADRLHSTALSAVVLKAKVSEDHFVKVRGLIKDIIGRLQADAEAEATQKGFCDQHMAEQLEARDTASSNLEDLTSQITGKEAEKAQLKAEVAELSKQVSQNAKALNEASELRSQESAENTEVIAKAGAGKTAVEDAIEVLSKFYDAQGFLQKGAYVPPNADRSGKTVGDLAPEIFDDEYKGKQTESKGIVGMLEVILSDFDRTEKTVTSDEEFAQTEFEEFESDTKKDSDEKNKSIEEKEDKITEAKDTLVSLTDQKKDASVAKELALDELKKLEKMCVAGEETYGERVAQRQQEIESLKQAMQILDDWKN